MFNEVVFSICKSAVTPHREFRQNHRNLFGLPYKNYDNAIYSKYFIILKEDFFLFQVFLVIKFCHI